MVNKIILYYDAGSKKHQITNLYAYLQIRFTDVAIIGRPEFLTAMVKVHGRIILRWIFRKWEGLWGLDGVGSG